MLPEQAPRGRCPGSGGCRLRLPACRAGDLILSVGGQEILSWYQLSGVIQDIGAVETEVVIERSGQRLRVQVKPAQSDGQGNYLLGIGPQTEVVTQRYGLGAAIRQGAQRTWELIDLDGRLCQEDVYRQCFPPRTSEARLPLSRLRGQAAQSGISAIFSVLAFISIQLGILNLLPIPILDGGHILFYLIEIIFRRPVSFRVREISQQVGMALLLLLMVLAFYNDIDRIVGFSRLFG